MIDAMRIAGRWVDRQILDRLSKRSSGECPPARSILIQEFCKATEWRNRKGELCLSSARVALNRLESLGLVLLPPSEPRSALKAPRRLPDDGEPLPPTPWVPASVERIKGLCLHLLSGADDPLHSLWNRLIIREHPLGHAPLVGTQLRYLIGCEAGYLGAFGFGPPAFHLECRDGWIGWDAAERDAHRNQVIGLARFLIRPQIRCANLASHSYGLVLRRVGQDWHERTGITPVLVETFVDRASHSGRSLAAANWRRLGQSQGRGRSSPSRHLRPKSPKDVWIYQLSPKAREILRRHPPLQIAPRSVLRAAPGPGWVEEELDGLKLGHALHERRFTAMLQARWNRPGRSLLASFEDAAAAKAAYRLIESPKAAIDFQSLLAPHQRQTHRRMAAEAVVLLAQDTTTLSYNTLHQTTGLGSTGDGAHDVGRGLLLHSLQAYRLDGIPLGCAQARLWARPPESDTRWRNEQSVAHKESGRWIQAAQSAARLAQAMPQTQLVLCGDRESDIYELYDQSSATPANLHLLVRAQHDRLLECGTKLWEKLQQTPVSRRQEVEIPRGRNRPERTATLELRWCEVEMSPPRVGLKKSWKPIRLHAVMAREIHAPEGTEPIEWVLLTTWKIRSAKTAWRMVQWYRLRWGIECWHQVLKDVCGVETRQLKTARALERALVLDMIVAWRALLLVRLGKGHPNLPAGMHYSAEELAVLELYKKKDNPRRCR